MTESHEGFVKRCRSLYSSDITDLELGEALARIESLLKERYELKAAEMTAWKEKELAISERDEARAELESYKESGSAWAKDIDSLRSRCERMENVVKAARKLNTADIHTVLTLDSALSALDAKEI